MISGFFFMIFKYQSLRINNHFYRTLLNFMWYLYMSILNVQNLGLMSSHIYIRMSYVQI